MMGKPSSGSLSHHPSNDPRYDPNWFYDDPINRNHRPKSKASRHGTSYSSSHGYSNTYHKQERWSGSKGASIPMVNEYPVMIDNSRETTATDRSERICLKKRCLGLAVVLVALMGAAVGLLFAGFFGNITSQARGSSAEAISSTTPISSTDGDTSNLSEVSNGTVKSGENGVMGNHTVIEQGRSGDNLYSISVEDIAMYSGAIDGSNEDEEGNVEDIGGGKDDGSDGEDAPVEESDNDAGTIDTTNDSPASRTKSPAVVPVNFEPTVASTFASSSIQNTTSPTILIPATSAPIVKSTSPPSSMQNTASPTILIPVTSAPVVKSTLSPVAIQNTAPPIEYFGVMTPSPTKSVRDADSNVVNIGQDTAGVNQQLLEEEQDDSIVKGPEEEGKVGGNDLEHKLFATNSMYDVEIEKMNSAQSPSRNPTVSSTPLVTTSLPTTLRDPMR